VPFSTLRYRSDPDYWRAWYPAQWISESFPGQFRNWFYSLIAMSTILERETPFRHVFTYATLMAEDGRPMHKSWGNSIEFNEAADRMGVDVMRWLYCDHKPEKDLLFGYHRADEVRRQFLIPLWNVYSFFVTYARIDGWTPGRGRRAQRSRMDAWILARLDETVRNVTASLEAYEPNLATECVDGLLNDLSNWYVRRSRRRFWARQGASAVTDADKEAAYATLYAVLVTLVRLLAPFVPFVTEVMYQNLVRSVRPTAYESVHHTAWPQGDLAVIDEDLLEQMELARQVASLGLSARNAAGLKVRQPLGRVLAYAGGRRSLNPELVEVVMDELNVKAFEFVEEAGRLVTYHVLPDNKLLGPRFGARFPRVRAALAALDPSGVAASVAAGLPVTLEVDGEIVELAPQEVLVETRPAEGLAVAADKLATVAVDANITPELKAEGLAREVVRRVQSMRKEAGFDISDRISTFYRAQVELEAVFRAWSEYIQAETLTTELVAGDPPEGAYTEEHKIDGASLFLGVRRN